MILLGIRLIKKTENKEKKSPFIRRLYEKVLFGLLSDRKELTGIQGQWKKAVW